MVFDKFRPLLVWFAMWVADVIPGVSGGTIAFITWIYDRLVGSIARVDKAFIIMVMKFQIAKAWKHIDGWFLTKVFGGILLAVISLAHLMEYLLETYPIYVFSFFFGLILASIILVWSHIQIRHIHHQKRTSLLLIVFAGIVLGYLATSSIHIDNEIHSPLSVFIAGMLASMAMILPGISGSYILVILWKYKYILSLISTQSDMVKDAISTWSYSSLVWPETGHIGLFIWGIIVGLLSFSKLLHRLLTHYKDITIAWLVGCMIGAIHVVWPWPAANYTTTEYLLWILLIVSGIVVIWGLHTISRKK